MTIKLEPDRDKAEQVFRFQASLLEHMRNAVIATDLEGKITFWNAFAETLYQWTAAEVLGKSILDVAVPDGEMEKVKALRAQTQRLGYWEGDCRVGRKDGSTFLAHVTDAVLKDGDGKSIGGVCVSEEITPGEQPETDLLSHGELFASRELVEVLSRRLIESQEEERRNLSRELHDEIGQVLTTVNLNLEGLRSKIDPTSIGRLEDSLRVVNTAIEQIRNMSLDLRPASLDLLGLDATLRVYLKRQASRAGLEVDFTSDLGRERFPAPVETVCFRVVQEALTNVFRHARAAHCWINLARSAGQIRISIRDDGRGFNSAVAKERALGGEGFGLLGMFERVQIAGGQMTIDSAAGCGTTILASFPLGVPVGTN